VIVLVFASDQQYQYPRKQNKRRLLHYRIAKRLNAQLKRRKEKIKREGLNAQFNVLAICVCDCFCICLRSTQYQYPSKLKIKKHLNRSIRN